MGELSIIGENTVKADIRDNAGNYMDEYIYKFRVFIRESGL